MQTVDAVVIGAGPNGLVAANLLADHGWDVMILETQDSVGGAVRSDNEVAPAYTHDTFSSFYPLAAASPTIRSLDLHQHGLVWAHAPAVVGTPYASGPWALLHRTAEETAAGLEAAAPGDGDAWLAMCRTWQRVGDSVVGALLSPFPPIKHGVGALARMSRHGGLAMVRQLLSPASTLTRQEFRGDGARMLLAANAAHADISLDAPGSGMLGWLLAMLGQHVGFPVPQGGAGMLANALADRFSAQGGSIRCGARVDQIVVRGGRASGVRTEHGDTIEVRRAIVADVAAPNLYGGLLAWEHLPPSLQGKMARFEWDPGTVKVDWALDGLIPWKDPPSHAPGTVHLCESIDELNITQVQLSAGAVPDRPFLILGQMTSSDATRSPTGTEAVWAYTHVPQRIRTDAATSASGRVRGTWDRDDAEAMADRMQRRVEEYAPDFASRVVARRALTPRDLEDRDENLVGGAINGGTASLQQQLFLRPVPGLGRAETPVRGLYLGSSSAHPGGGVHGACGANAARAALAHDRVRRVWRGWRPERDPA